MAIRNSVYDTSKSKDLYERAVKVLPEGVSSGARGPLNYKPFPPYMREAKGSHVWDVDGNEYIDWQLSYGNLPLGHAHPKIIEIVQDKITGGSHLATALEVEVETAELMVKLMPHVDKVRFASSGTEACMTGVRIARGLTGKRKVLKFEGHYHGWYDGLLVSSNPQPWTTLGHPNDPIRIIDSSGLTPGSTEDTLVTIWNDEEALERVLKTHGHDIACVITEGIMSNMGIILPKPGYLKRLEELCKQYGVLFYLDETVTGFRMAPGGAAEVYGLKPDIVTFGKALGQGFPVAAIAGPDHIMESIEYGKVLHFGSNNAHRIGLFAAKTAMEEMSRDDGAGYKKINAIGDEMTRRLNQVAKDVGIGMLVQNYGSMFHPVFTDQPEITGYRQFCSHVDVPRYGEFAQKLREQGVYFTGNKILHNVACIAHSQDDMDRTIEAAGIALEQMKTGK
jgi:glutamate-1-semialdehyde 2,1-aminomutase